MSQTGPTKNDSDQTEHGAEGAETNEDALDKIYISTNKWILRGVGVFAGIVVVFIILTLGFSPPSVVVNEVTVPKELQDFGYSPNAIAEGIVDRMQQIRMSAQTSKHSMSVELSQLNTKALPVDLEFAGSKVSIDQIGIFIKNQLHNPDINIYGSIVHTEPGEASGYRIVLWGSASHSSGLFFRSAPAKTVKELVDSAALSVMEHVDPFILASYYYKEESENKSLDYENTLKTIKEIFQPMKNYMTAGAVVPSETFIRTVNLWGVVLLHQHKYEEAAEKFDEAVSDAKLAGLPKLEAMAFVNLGLARKAQFHPADAIAAFRNAIAVSMDDAQAYFNLGVVLQIKADALKGNEKIESLRQSLYNLNVAADLDPANANIGLERGYVLMHSGYPRESIQQYVHVIALNPGFALAYNNLCYVHYSEKNYQRAAAECRTAIELDGTTPFPRNTLALILTDMKDRDGALDQYQAVLDHIDPMNDFALSKFIQLAHDGPRSADLERFEAELTVREYFRGDAR